MDREWLESLAVAFTDGQVTAAEVSLALRSVVPTHRRPDLRVALAMARGYDWSPSQLYNRFQGLLKPGALTQEG